MHPVTPIELRLNLVALTILAAYPWARAFGLVGPATDWRPWLAAVGAQAVWMLMREFSGRLISAIALMGIFGTALELVTMVYSRTISGLLHMDYYILASVIHSASFNLLADVPNIWFDLPGNSEIANYFDLITPLLNRVFDLTHDPFRLLGFHALMIFSAPVAVWFICSHLWRLSAFQLALPVGLLLHPAVTSALVSDYHNSEVALGILLVGTYCYFAIPKRSWIAFALLLLGTLLKVSYWPSFAMFGLLSAISKRWAWAATYVGTAVIALGTHHLLARGSSANAVAYLFGNLGHSPSEVLANAVLHPELWLGHAIAPQRWLFLVVLLLPIGFCVFAYPPGIILVLPLFGFTMLDSSGLRSMQNEYATEYLGYLVGSGLFGLNRVSNRFRVGFAAVLAVGLVSTFVKGHPAGFKGQPMNIPIAISGTGQYLNQAAFGECAIGQSLVLTTSPYWISYDREYPEDVWLDLGGAGPTEAHPQGIYLANVPWDAFQTLVFPENPDVQFSVVDFPDLPPHMDVGRYRQLFDRLPVSVRVPRGGTQTGWIYRGGDRLADCGRRYGYDVSRV